MIFSFNKIPNLALACCLLSLSVISPGLAQARRPLDNNVSPQLETCTWIKNGVASQFQIQSNTTEKFVTVEQVAQLAEAQLRWQAVSQEACLSRVNQLLCFNWEHSKITHNEKGTSKKYQVIFSDNKLFVPFNFLLSKEFSSFSKTEVVWNESQKVLLQTTPITLQLPPAENRGDRYRFSVSVDESTPYHLLQQDQKRVWVQFLKARTEGSQILEGDNVVREVRIVQHRGSADLLIYLGGNAKSSEVTFDSSSKKLIIDIFLLDQTTTVSVPSASRASKKTIPIITTPPPSQMVKSTPRALPGPVLDKKIRTIVVDAGHGGFDCGAIGTRGTLEKEINLRVAKELAKQLEKEDHTRVILTRDRDEFIALNERTQIANNAKADLFISIHCNSSLSSELTGFEVYILSPDASDEAAASVARMENAVTTLESKKGDGTTKLSELLASMAIYTFINESSKCAGMICKAVKDKASVHKTSVKEANFHVLRGAQMPGVLIELDYLSNPVTEIKLKSSRYTGQVIKGILGGVGSFEESARKKKQTLRYEANQPIQKAQK